MVDYEKGEALYRNSIEVLKKVQLENGGCIATPEGERYPYVYPRDHAFCILAFLEAGMDAEARRGLEFVYKAPGDSGAFPQRYDTSGKDASYKPVQIDGTGLILYAFAEYVKKTNDIDFAKENWLRVEKAVDYIKQNFFEEKSLVYTPNSIHEFPPIEDGLEIWANCVCYASLKELECVAGLMKKEFLHAGLGSRIRDGIIRYMWNSRIKSFVKTIRVRESSSVEINPDASQIGVSEFGVLPDTDERVDSTVKRIEKNLWNKKLGGICRYPKYEGRHNGGWGPWPHFTMLLCKHYIRQGNRRKADKYLKWVLKTAYKNDLPEHISTREEFEEYVIDFTEAGLLRKDRMILIENAKNHPKYAEGIAYISLPLAWPHAEYIRTWNLYKKTFDKGLSSRLEDLSPKRIYRKLSHAEKKVGKGHVKEKAS